MRAELDRAFGDMCAASGEYRWAVVAAFYAAVHYCNALLVRGKMYSDTLDHKLREEHIRSNFAGALTPLIALRGKSMRARYYYPTWAADEDTWKQATKHVDRLRDFTRRVLDGKVPGL